MKLIWKLTALLMAVVFSCISIGLAEGSSLDYSSMTDEELKAIIETAQNELVNRNYDATLGTRINPVKMGEQLTVHYTDLAYQPCTVTIVVSDYVENAEPSVIENKFNNWVGDFSDACNYVRLTILVNEYSGEKEFAYIASSDIELCDEFGICFDKDTITTPASSVYISPQSGKYGYYATTTENHISYVVFDHKYWFEVKAE